MTKTSIVITGFILLAGAGTGLVKQHHCLEEARLENIELRSKTEEMVRLRQSNERLRRHQVDPADLEQWRKEHEELMRLRSEVAALRAARLAPAEPVASPPAPEPAPEPKLAASEVVGVEKLADAGLGTPEAAVKTFFWALQRRSGERLQQVVDWEKFQRDAREIRRREDPEFDPAQEYEEEFSIDDFPAMPGFTGYQVLVQEINRLRQAELQVEVTARDGVSLTKPLRFNRVDGEWKLDVIGSSDPSTFQVEKKPAGTAARSRASQSQTRTRRVEGRERRAVPTR